MTRVITDLQNDCTLTDLQNDFSEDKLNKICDELKGDFKLVMTLMAILFKQVRADCAQLANSKDEEISKLKLENATLTSKLTKLEDAIDEADANDRRDTIIISGPAIPAATSNESVKSIVQTILKDEIGCEVELSDISIAHRLGKRSVAQSTDKRSLIVKLCHMDTKRKIFECI